MKIFFIAFFALFLLACSSVEDSTVEQKPVLKNQKVSNSISLAHRELLAIIDEQNYLFENYKGEITDKVELAQMNTKYKKIVSRWQNYISQYPQDLDAIIIYGKFLRAVGEFTNAYTAFLEVDKIDPNIAVVKQQLATFQGDYGLFKEALANMKKAIELAPEEALYYYQLAELLCVFYNEYLLNESFEKEALNAFIEENFEKAIALDPKNTHFYWRYAQSFYQQSQANWQKALNAWEMLEPFMYINLDKNNLLVNKARVLIELYRDDEALAILEKIDTPSLEKNKTRLVNIIKAQKEGDLLQEEILKLEEKESTKAEAKKELDSPHTQEKFNKIGNE